MAELFYPLFIAHLLSDFALQTYGMVEAKFKYGARGVWPHIAVVGLMTTLSVVPQLQQWWLYVLIITVIHFVIDVAKVTVDQKVKNSWGSKALFLLDQFLHWVVLCGATFFARQAGLEAVWNISALIWEEALLGVFATFVVGILFLVFAPTYEWPNRWPATIARAAIFLLTIMGFVWLAPIPAALAVGYHRLRGQLLTQGLWIETIVGTAVAVWCGLVGFGGW